jgi:hypothetical protein
MASLLAVGVLTGCSPAVQGLGGVRLDAEQGLVAVLGLCPDFGDLTIIKLYTAEPDGSVGDPVVTLHRVGAAPPERYVEVSLSDPPPGWRADKKTPTMDHPSQTFELRAWNGDGDNRVAGFPFQVSELRDQRESTKPILSKTFVGTRNGTDQYETSLFSPEEFRQATERECRNG